MNWYFFKGHQENIPSTSMTGAWWRLFFETPAEPWF